MPYSLITTKDPSSPDMHANKESPLEGFTKHISNIYELYLPVERGCTQLHSVKNSIFSNVLPTPLKDPKLILKSDKCLQLIMPSSQTLSDETLTELFSGNRILPQFSCLAHCYCGHQFGVFAGQLGDGCAITLCQVLMNNQRLSLQLKGCGLTQFSRQGDGRKVLRSSIREFLMSEHFHALHIPTTRAATLIKSSDHVTRDPLHCNRLLSEPCAVILRVSPTFFRFGSFEIFKKPKTMCGKGGPSAHAPINLKYTLANYIISFLYPELLSNEEKEKAENSKLQLRFDESIYVAWVQKVIEKTARLVAMWQAYGWVHGVLNTDNMSIIGETLDYGPYGFMERYNPYYIPNLSDDGGKYCYQEQPYICRWNCVKLLEAIEDIIPQKDVEDILTIHFDMVYGESYLNLMRTKLGLHEEDMNSDGDKNLIEELLEVMRDTAADYTCCLRILGYAAVQRETLDYKCIQSVLGNLADLKRSCGFSKLDLYEIHQLIEKVRYEDPSVIQSHYDISERQLNMMKEVTVFAVKVQSVLLGITPKEENDKKLWTAWLSKFKDRLIHVPADEMEKRKLLVQNANPSFILRNSTLSKVIDSAYKGNYRDLSNVFEACINPCSGDPQKSQLPPKPGTPPFTNTCSS